MIIADPAEFVGGSLQGTFDRIGLTNITGVITPQQTTGPNAATGKISLRSLYMSYQTHLPP